MEEEIKQENISDEGIENAGLQKDLKQEQPPETQEIIKNDELAKNEKINLEDRSYENIEKITEAKGIVFKEIKDEFVNNGCKLTNNILEKYVKAGFSVADVEAISQSFSALHEQEMNDIAQVVGGREVLNETLGWAKNNLEPEKLEAIRNDLAKNPSELMAKAMVTYLHNQMIEKEGKPPNYLTNTAGGNMSGDIFKSKAEAMKAMSDPRYIPNDRDYDEVFAKEIDEKLERTNKINGKPLFE